MKIAHFGTFDVDNYGDLLFPHIARYRLPDHEWIHVSPTSFSTQFNDSLPVISYQEALSQNFDAVVIGGGNIIHAREVSLPVYKTVALSAYASLWIGAAKIALNQNIPLAFNSPGISTIRHNLLERKFFRSVLSNTEYISFRDSTSADIAKNYTNKSVWIVPDTALDISRMWPIKNNNSLNENYLVCNLNPRYHSPAKETAQLLDTIALKIGMPIKLIIVGDCHGDMDFAAKISTCLTTSHSIEPISSLKHMAHTIAQSDYFLGSSMHGFITALSYKVPALLVLNKTPMWKFIGLLELTGLSRDVICSSFYEVNERLINPALINQAFSEKVYNSLDYHWRMMINSLSIKGTKRVSHLINNFEKLLHLIEPIDKLQKVKSKYF